MSFLQFYQLVVNFCCRDFVYYQESSKTNSVTSYVTSTLIFLGKQNVNMLFPSHYGIFPASSAPFLQALYCSCCAHFIHSTICILRIFKCRKIPLHVVQQSASEKYYFPALSDDEGHSKDVFNKPAHVLSQFPFPIVNNVTRNNSLSMECFELGIPPRERMRRPRSRRRKATLGLFCARKEFTCPQSRSTIPNELGNLIQIIT